MTYYWLLANGKRVWQFAHPERLTTLERRLWETKYARENRIANVSIKEVDRKLYEVAA